MDAFEGRGGLRAEILHISNISVGDELLFGAQGIHDYPSRMTSQEVNENVLLPYD
jgi:hypothetical protein